MRPPLRKGPKDVFRPRFLVTLLDRVKAIVRRVARPAAKRTGPARAGAADHVRADQPISPALRGLMHGWMSTKLAAVSALLRRIEVGERLERQLPTLRKREYAHVARAFIINS
jgi:hypothetical protein